MKNSLLYFLCALGLTTAFSRGQTVLSREDALALALEHNYGILMSRNTLEVADNNRSLANAGFLPNLAVSSGATYNNADTDISFPGQFLEDGTPRPDLSINEAISRGYNARLTLNYTLFDGGVRWFNYQRLRTQYQITELQLRETIEQTVLQLFTVYFQVAFLEETLVNSQEALSISKDRAERAEAQFGYGQSNKLAVLNAQVDVTNDSIALLGVQRQLSTAQRDLNTLLGRSVDQSFTVDKDVTWASSELLSLSMEEALQNNVDVLQAKALLAQNKYDIKIAQGGYLPSVGLNGAYGWNENQNPRSAFFPGTINDSYSLGLGATLTWNLFDGGRTIIRTNNARIALENQTLAEKQTLLQMERDLRNARQNYENALEIYELQSLQVTTAQNNFERTKALYAQGSITSVEFRQAQLNWTNALIQRSRAKYDAKLAEMTWLRLSGSLLRTAP
jgi:outer membrane protein